MRKLLTLFILLASFNLQAQKTDKKLQAQIQQLVQGFKGDIGVCVIDLKHHKIVEVNADTVFPTASIVKIPILTGIMQKLEKGELDYHQRLLFTDSLRYDEGDDMLGSFKDSSTIELSKVMLLMITTSDNCASLWLQGLAGTGEHINAILDSLGFKVTRVNSRTPGRSGNRTQYGWGQTSPREMATFMNRIVEGTILSKQSSEKMLRLLGRQYWDEEAMSQIPPGVFIADKTGAVDASRCEIMYVNNNKNPYILSVFTKNNQDTSWQYNNEAWVLTRKLSALIWKYYSPKSEWVGAPFNK